MTLLDDARRLLEDPCQSAGCSYCGARMQQAGPYGYAGWCHLLTCPLHRIRVQRLVAALEAAERLAQEEPSSDLSDCVYCGKAPHDPIQDRSDHTPDCPWRALAAALKDEG